jgi:hypothetical protein
MDFIKIHEDEQDYTTAIEWLEEEKELQKQADEEQQKLIL